MSNFGLDDLDVARRLQEEYDREAAAQLAAESDPSLSRSKSDNASLSESRSPFSSQLSIGISPVDPSLEVTDPNPDIRELFLQFNDKFFWSRLAGIEVKWSPRMTLCAGLCVYEGHGGLCSVRLSLPLLKLRPRKDLVETLLHEMIHAFLFVTNNDRDHDDHGPNFKNHMSRINKETGANISIYHTFHDEVASYQQHWWKCEGPCQKRPPYYGMVKRAMNRPPSNRDPWFNEHQFSCGGTFIKVKEPEGYGQKKGKSKTEKSDKAQNASYDIRTFVGKGTALGGSSLLEKSFSIGSSKESSGAGSTHDSKGKGLAVITNGVLTHKKNPGVTAPPDKNSSFLFSSVASTSGSSVLKTSNPALNSKVSVGRGLNKYLGSNRPSTSSVHSSSENNVKGKGKFNDNITLLELFKQRQARENTKKETDLNNKQGLTSNKSVVSEDNEHNTDGKLINKSDSVVDLTESDTDDFDTTSSSTDSFKRSKDRGSEKKQWKNIFPTMSGKKDRDKFKGIGKNKLPRKFISVCDGGDYHDVKPRKKRPIGDKKKPKYIIDELDSNDGLWEEGSSSASASEEKPVKSFKKTVDLIQSYKNNLSVDKPAQSNNGSEKDEDHQDLGSKLMESNMSSGVVKKEELKAGPSAGGLNGHVLGRGESGLSFLAQMRKKLQDERENHHPDGSSKNLVKSSSSDLGNNNSCNKRRSGAAFGDVDIAPSSKRPSNSSSGLFIAEEQDQKGRTNSIANSMVPCPICTELVQERDINDHLDRCLE